MRVTLSERVLAVGTILMKSGVEGQDAVEDAVEVLGGVEVVVADDEGDAGLAELLEVGLLEVLRRTRVRGRRSGSRRAAALVRISTSAAMVPANLPPLAARRQVAMAVAAVLSAEELLDLGQREQGLLEVVEAELEEGSSP